MEFGFARWEPHDLDILPFHTCAPTSAQGFERRFLRSEASGVMDLRVGAFLAVLDFTFCIYSIEKTVAEALNGIADPIVLDDVDTDAGDHECLCYR